MKTGAIFDVDGTLVDSNDLHARAFVDAFAECGLEVAFARVRPLIGVGGDKLVEAVAPEARPSTRERVAERKAGCFRDRYLAQVRPFPGARDLLLRLQERGVGIAIATSAKRDEVAELLKIAGVDDLIDAQATADDARRSKPDPDIVTAALTRSGFAPKASLMIGDTPYDIEAAARAGLDSLGFRSGGWWKDGDLAGALALYDGPRDLSDRLEGSAFFSTRPPWYVLRHG